MLKRLIGVILVKNNWAVQSIGYQRYLPLGRPEIIAENYDNWQLDEILIIDIDRSKLNLGPNFQLLDKVAQMKLMTPLCYMGGIRGVDDALQVIKKGADRIAMESLYKTDPSSASLIANSLGRQAVIRVLPLVVEENLILCHDYQYKEAKTLLDPKVLVEGSSNFSELMIVDVNHEGYCEAFNEDLLLPFVGKNIQLICFGGVTSNSQVSRLHAEDDVSAVAIGNSLSYREIAHKSLLSQTEVSLARQTSFGNATKGAREW